MRLSIVTAVLNSHEVVRRQALHYKKMPLPDDVEWVICDDKSDPPLNRDDYDLPRLTIVRHPLQGQWTQPAARNYGAKHAVGEYLLCTDIDHILSPTLIDYARTTSYDFVKLQREVAVLDENGDFIQTEEEVKRYGYEDFRFARHRYHISPHTNSFIIRRQLYLDLGGVSEKRVEFHRHPNREENALRRQLFSLRRQGKIKILDEYTDGVDQRPLIYLIPNGKFCGHKDFNPFGLFHSLKRNGETSE